MAARMISTVARRVRFVAGIRPTRLTLLVLALFTVIAVVAAAPVGAASGGRGSDTVTFYGADVVSVDTVSGFKASPQRFANTLSAVYAGSEWDFFSDGTFAFTPNADGVGNEDYLYPIVGVWQAGRNDTITIKGESASALSKSPANRGPVVQYLTGVIYAQGDGAYIDIQETDLSTTSKSAAQGKATYTVALSTDGGSGSSRKA